MKHVFSTLSSDVRYNQTEKLAGGLHRITRSVLIRGGAGVALLGAGQQLITRSGRRTEVSDDDAAWLETNEVFQLHKSNGFVRIEGKARDPEVAAATMEASDPSKPKTPQDVKKDAEAAAAQTGLSPSETLQAVTNKKR